MKISFEIGSRTYRSSLEQAVSLGVVLQFQGPQPNHFGAPPANASPLKLGNFLGDTQKGGSCNVDEMKLIPHCNGTHTETISHIVHEDIWSGHAVSEILCLAVLISVPTTPASQTSDSYRPALENTDTVITSAAINNAYSPYRSHSPSALVVRSLPNTIDKKHRQYANGPQPAFFTCDAMATIGSINCRHLVVDLPSVDRMYDDGLLTNHHLFWTVPEGTHQITSESRQDKTITEMAFIPDEVPDGVYLLNLQIPPFASDAAPSRPMLIPTESMP